MNGSIIRISCKTQKVQKSQRKDGAAARFVSVGRLFQRMSWLSARRAWRPPSRELRRRETIWLPAWHRIILRRSFEKKLPSRRTSQLPETPCPTPMAASASSSADGRRLAFDSGDLMVHLSQLLLNRHWRQRHPIGQERRRMQTPPPDICSCTDTRKQGPNGRRAKVHVQSFGEDSFSHDFEDRKLRGYYHAVALQNQHRPGWSAGCL